VIYKPYNVGDVIVQDLVGERRLVRVVKKLANVKKGLPGFHGTCVLDGEVDYPEVWGYDYEVVEVNPKG